MYKRRVSGQSYVTRTYAVGGRDRRADVSYARKTVFDRCRLKATRRVIRDHVISRRGRGRAVFHVSVDRSYGREGVPDTSPRRRRKISGERDRTCTGTASPGSRPADVRARRKQEIAPASSGGGFSWFLLDKNRRTFPVLSRITSSAASL